MSTTRERGTLKIALFVEGSREKPGADDPLEHLWASVLVEKLDLRSITRVVGISKASLVAMGPTVQNLAKKTTAYGLPLDVIIAEELRKQAFDIAVVAWDLQPPWDPRTAACRWNELKALYRGLGASKKLPPIWREAAQGRLDELESRTTPRAGKNPLGMERCAVHALWMKPDFEGIIAHEGAIKAALGVSGRQVPGWPRDWSEKGPKRMDGVIEQAIGAVRRLKPRPPKVRRLNLPFRSAKHGWASLLIAEGGDAMARHITQHSTGVRLRELLGRSAGGH